MWAGAFVRKVACQLAGEMQHYYRHDIFSGEDDPHESLIEKSINDCLFVLPCYSKIKFILN